MKREELKKMIRPIVRECVHEAILEGGLLSGIISEVALGLGNANQVTIQETRDPDVQHQLIEESRSAHIESLRKKKEELLDKIGKDSYNGINLFEGTAPMQQSAAASPTSLASPLANRDPKDAGVDISGILALGGKNWKAFMK